MWDILKKKTVDGKIIQLCKSGEEHHVIWSIKKDSGHVITMFIRCKVSFAEAESAFEAAIKPRVRQVATLEEKSLETTEPTVRKRRGERKARFVINV